jgi:hypothetical protein
VIHPLRNKRTFDSSFSLTLIEPPDGKIENPWSAESGFVETQIPRVLEDLPLFVVPYSEIESKSAFVLPRSRRFSGVWARETATVENLGRFLWVLQKTFNEVIIQTKPDIVVFCRPDVFICRPLWLGLRILSARLSALVSPKVALLPAWGRHRGYNDRFAVLSVLAARDYFQRQEVALEYFEQQPGGNPEGLLKYAMADSLVMNSIFSPMVRMRLGGRVDPVDEKMLNLTSLQIRLPIYFTRIATFFRRVLREIKSQGDG